MRETTAQDRSGSPDAARSVRLDFDAGHVSYDRLPPHAFDGFTSTSGSFAFGVSFTGHHEAVVQRPSGRVSSRTFAPGTVGLNGVEPLTWLHVTEPSEGLEIHPSAEALDLVADRTGCDWQAHDTFRQVGCDPVVWAICARFRMATRGARDIEPLDADAAILMLARHVAVRHFGGRERRRFPGKLDARRLERTVAYLRANLDRRVSLTELASVAAMSAYHFQRAFKRTTGLSPADYAMALRAERAHRLLAQGATLGCAGACVGIDDGSYLRRILNRHVGALRH